MKERKKMQNAQTWVSDTEKAEALRLAEIEDVTLSKWIRRAIKEKLLRDKK